MNSDDELFEFPPVSQATSDGLVLVGGLLNPNWVLSAYMQGVFPWPIVDAGYEVLAWFSPDPRAIIELDALYVSRRLARRIRSGRFRVTVDRAFARVIAECAEPRDTSSETWITAGMIRVYRDLHARGYAHSLEVWRGDLLVGGLYGLSIGGFFAGESMFHRETDASKVAMAYLVAHLQARGFELLDVQQATEHAVRMGAIEIPRAAFLKRLERAVAADISFGIELDTSKIGDLLER